MNQVNRRISGHGIQKLFTTQQGDFRLNRGKGEWVTTIEGRVNSDEALKLAGLDWNVQVEEIQTISGKPIQNKKALINPTNGEILSVMSDSYAICENKTAFSFVDAIPNSEIVAGGFFGKGEIVWMVSKIQGLMTLKNGEEIEQNLMVLNSHNGSKQVMVLPVPTRLACTNIFNSLLAKGNSFKIRHSAGLEGKLEQAKKALGFTGQYYSKLGKEFDDLISYFLSVDEAFKIVNYILEIDQNEKIPKQKQDLRDNILSNFQHGVGNEGKSGFDLLNAFTQYSTHEAKTKGVKGDMVLARRFQNSVLENSLNAKAFEVIKACRNDGLIPVFKTEKTQDFLGWIEQ